MAKLHIGRNRYRNSLDCRSNTYIVRTNIHGYGSDRNARLCTSSTSKTTTRHATAMGSRLRHIAAHCRQRRAATWKFYPLSKRRAPPWHSSRCYTRT